MGRRRGIAEGQLSLFELLKEEQKWRDRRPEPGSMNISAQLRQELSRTLKQCPLSRFEVAARMSELLDVEISKSQLDSWTAESKEYHRFPAEYLAAFCRATGHYGPLELIARRAGCYLAKSEQVLLAELGRIEYQRRELARQEKAVRRMLEAVRD